MKEDKIRAKQEVRWQKNQTWLLLVQVRESHNPNSQVRQIIEEVQQVTEVRGLRQC